jgi:hypothetical protein
MLQPPLNSPKWLPGGHLQTLWRKLSATPQPVRDRQRLLLSDGDFIDVDHARVAEPGWRNRPWVLLVHGLGGSSASPYVMAMQAALQQQGYATEDMTDIEMAKLQIRYMVGGRAPAHLQHEVVYRVEFPERPGALLKFLSGLGQRWNISMFHYRNHGAAYGRILLGVQVPRAERREFREVLEAVGYPFWDETRNRAYQLYLGQARPAS